jgi:hypothetical protein
VSNSISINTRATPAAASNDTAVTASNRAKMQLNVSILQESASISLNSGNDPLALLYKSAITSINEQLEADFGPDAIQNALGQDNSPARRAALYRSRPPSSALSNSSIRSWRAMKP